MGTDAVSICNMAFGHLGDLGKIKRMSSFSRAGCTQDTHHVALDFYESAKIEMHGMMDWQRTRKVGELTVSDDDPLLSGKWTYKYVRPPDALIFRKVLDSYGAEYEYDQVNEIGADNKNAEWIYANVEDAIGWWTILIGEERYMPGMDVLHSLILARDLAMTVTAKPEARLALVQELRGDARNFCMSLAAQEGYIENEAGKRELTDLY
jgi:hypothetical protein